MQTYKELKKKAVIRKRSLIFFPYKKGAEVIE
jgi:hypothetical protein